MKTKIYLLILLSFIGSICLFASEHPSPEFAQENLPSFYQTERADSAHGFDITKYDLSLNVNFQTHYINGTVKAWVTAQETLSNIAYNLVGLTVSQVKVNDAVTTFSQQNNLVQINLTAFAGQEFTTEVSYSGIPQLSPSPYNLGIIFGTNTCFTISDPDAARYWWPCYDHPWDKAVVDLHITTRDDWLVACNGLRSSIIDNGNGTKTHNWVGSNPMATYLVCFTAAPYVEINQTAGSIPIQNFVLSNQYNNALTDFSTLPSILQYYSSLFGSYPFEKYGNATVNMTTYGAMEHQTMTTLGMQYITGNHSGELTIAHELAHSWFGNCVTPLSYKDVWLSEGFATYSEFLWMHERDGWQAACNYMQNDIHQYYINWETGNANLPNIIYDPPFNYYFYPQSYEKAASVLHMLRLKIGDAAFFQVLQNWVNIYHNGNGVTAEFQALAEQISGQDLHQFFRQWIYSRGIPSASYILMLNENSNQAKIIAETTCSTGTEFTLDIPLQTTGLAAGDSLVIIADPDGYSNLFSLASGVGTYQVNNIDPQHWNLCRQYTALDINFTQCLPSNHSIYLSWEPFLQLTNLTGYMIYRRTENETEFTCLTSNPLLQTDYLDNEVQNGIRYYYQVKAADAEGFLTMGSNIMNAAPVAFPFDWGMLVVDETKDGNGTNISPDDAAVDNFYAAAINPLPYANWDCATLGLPSLDTLSHYPLVLWHADDYAQNLIGGCLDVLSSYLLGNGKLVISGWKTPAVFTPNFTASFLPNTDLIYDSGAVLISVFSENYPELQVDQTKLISVWNGMLPMIYTFNTEATVLYTANMTEGANGNGLPACLRYDNHGTLILFGFPLYYMQADGVRALLQQLLPELYPVLAAEDYNLVPAALQINLYPNPCRNLLNLNFSAKIPPEAKLQIFNSKGKKIASLNPGKFLKADNNLQWKLACENGNSLPAGIYFLRYSDRRQVKILKFVLLP